VTVCILVRDSALQRALAGSVRRLGYEACELDGSDDFAACAAPSAAILDDGLPALGSAIAALRERAPRAGLVVLSGRADARSVVDAFGLGADEVLRKPFDLAGLSRALQSVWRSGAPAPSLDFVAEDPGMRAALRTLGRAVDTDLTVTLSGETGSGRSLLARWLHARGPRRGAPRVELSALELDPVRCVEELCGDPSDADSMLARPSRLEVAHGGTLVLDGVDAFPLQAQEIVLSRLHGEGARIDARVIAIASRPLAELADGEMIEDLRRRLQVVEVGLPSLRERPGDLVPLAQCFLARAAQQAGVEPALLGVSARAELQARRWRGNVRELENLMARAAVVFPGVEIQLEWLEQSLQPAAASSEAAPPSLNLRQLERAAIARSLHLAGGSRSAAARSLGISVRTLRNKIRRYELA
jgi:two-component system response regulator FlrC